MKRPLLFSLITALLLTAPLPSNASEGAKVGPPVKRAAIAPPSAASPSSDRPIALDVAKAPTPRATSAGAAPRRRLSAEQKALLEIEADGQASVGELARQIEGMPDNAARRELQLRAVAIKQETRVRMLRTMASFARNRGDLAGTKAIETQLESMLHPESRAPLNSPSEFKKGGK